MLNKDLEEIFAIIDDELEKRKLNTFLLWDFPNDVKKRIKELYQSIDNTSSSEALEELKRIENNISYLLSDCDINEEVNMNFNSIIKHKSCDIIKQALLKSQEQEKVLKIIFEKYVDLNLLDCDDEVGQYNRHFGKDRQLTQEEFDTVKRWQNGK